MRSRRSPSRTASAALLLVAALAALLVAWFLSGWADVRAQRRELQAAPERAAVEQAAELAGDLRAELGRLLRREVERPYFHYQNLMHDPRTGGTANVVPSPLASAPVEALIRGYFQIDSAGQVTTPTLNDDIPALSDNARLADHRRFRDEVARSLQSLQPAPGKVLVAAVEKPVPPRQAPPRPVPQQQAPPPNEERQQEQASNSNAQRAQAQQAPPAQVIELDENSYAQNLMPSDAYRQQNAIESPSQAASRVQGRARITAEARAAAEARAIAEAQAAEAQAKARAAARARAAAKARAVAKAQAAEAARARPLSVPITIASLEWRTLPFAGVPSLVAVRHVETPDRNLTQGFLIDPGALTSWLGSHGDGSEVTLAARGGGRGAEVVPGWYLDVAASPRAIARAAGEGVAVATAFLLRFVIVGVIALLSGILVVVLVARAERLARERSQFAAAAAHELRTPLAGLQLYGDMLADGLGDPAKLADYARRMSEEASRLGRVVSNVLGFSQLERGNLSVEAQRGDLAAALRELVERAQPALDRAGVALDLDVPPDLSARFDRDALARIVGNLLDNAEKYSRDAADRTIGLAAREAGGRVEVAITDRGPGVAPATRGKLFRAFSRGVTSDGPAGLGLGLALSQSLARAMGGELEYRAAPAGDGATFVLSLAG